MAKVNSKLIFVSSDVSFGNMSLTRGDPKKALNNRLKFYKSQKLKPSQIIVASPNHGTEVALIKEKSPAQKGDIPGTDALITNLKDTFLMMKTGDCIPIGLFDPKTKTVALIHASRTSLNEKIIKKVLVMMSIHFKSTPADLIVRFGPSICHDCYQLEYPPINQKLTKLYLTKIGKTYNLNLWNFAHDRLIEAGVDKNNIYNPKICTYHSNKYFSHKKTVKENLPNDYRFATIIGLKY